jgi:hypothetical protein
MEGFKIYIIHFISDKDVVDLEILLISRMSMEAVQWINNLHVA